MCWIFAYNGKKNAIPLLVEGLRTLEYRGYDSAGIAAVNEKKEIFLEKATGKVSNLASKVQKHPHAKDTYQAGIAHTRWATHGKVTLENTHPHVSQNERFYVVHNGIIENYMGIKNILEKKYHFYGDTDSEIIAKLIEDSFDGDLLSTVTKVCEKLVWAYAIVVLDRENPDIIIGAKLGSPMIVGEGDDGVFIASDINAISHVAKEFVSLEDGETVVITHGKKEIYSLGERIIKTSEVIDHNQEMVDKGNFDTFTEKEIYEIPEVIKNVCKGRVDFEKKEIINETLESLGDHEIKRIEIIASGSSYFAGQVGSYWLKTLALIPTEVRISSEFLYDTFLPHKKTLYIFISQSGETADVRECLKMVKAKWCLTFGIVNVVGSTIARMCDLGLYSHAGVEVGVASTKNIIGQYGVLLLLALSLWIKRDLQIHQCKTIIEELWNLPDTFELQLQQANTYKEIAKKYAKYPSMFFLGRNILYPVAAEGSLKLKELSYIHSECYTTGELKHGPLALIDENTPSFVLNLKGIMQEKTISNVREIQARNGKVIGIITSGEDKSLYDDVIEVPETSAIVSPFLPLVPIWIMSVEIAKILGRDVDKPQNLAKSVTVE